MSGLCNFLAAVAFWGHDDRNFAQFQNDEKAREITPINLNGRLETKRGASPRKEAQKSTGPTANPYRGSMKDRSSGPKACEFLPMEWSMMSAGVYPIQVNPAGFLQRVFMWNSCRTPISAQISGSKVQTTACVCTTRHHEALKSRSCEIPSVKWHYWSYETRSREWICCT